MRFLRLSALATLLFLVPAAHSQEVRRYRQWIENVETGGIKVSSTPEQIETQMWTAMERLGATTRQDIHLVTTRTPKGEIRFTWKIVLASEPMTGVAVWSPSEPDILRIDLPGLPSIRKTLPPGTILWPADDEILMREAARDLRPLKLNGFSEATQQWTELDLQPVKTEALPGFPDTVRFRGSLKEGPMLSDMEIWISPKEGEIRTISQTGGVSMLVQRAELPAPARTPEKAGFFEQTLAELPPHPFLRWLPEATLRWTGPGIQELPLDDQQTRLADNRYHLKAPAPPRPEEAAQRPVEGTPTPEEAPYLAQTPLLMFQEPVFRGLITRMRPSPQATRWDLARQVTSFVYDWIDAKNLSVGFAAAQEVARIPKGDCTEHGVLAVALLRRLGVPARGVTGWVGLRNALGIHFWVEVLIGKRWIPVDPTFHEAPASALRLKLGTTDLSDLASIGWNASTLRLTGGAWLPEKPWSESLKLKGDSVVAEGIATLRVRSGSWSMEEGRLALAFAGRHFVEACLKPSPSQMSESKHLLGQPSNRRGWWQAESRILWVDLGGDRWLQVDRMDEHTAFRLLDRLEAAF